MLSLGDLVSLYLEAETVTQRDQSRRSYTGEGRLQNALGATRLVEGSSAICSVSYRSSSSFRQTAVFSSYSVHLYLHPPGGTGQNCLMPLKGELS